MQSIPPRGRRVGIAVVLVVLMGLVAGTYLGRKSLALHLLPDFADWPVNTQGYEVEVLPFPFAASFVRGHSVFLIQVDGTCWQGDDRRIKDTLAIQGSPPVKNPRMIFVSSRGAILVSAPQQMLQRSTDNGRTWAPVLDASAWRMDETDGKLFLGNYGDVSLATVYCSEDQGETWRKVWTHHECEHVHTVRWDNLGQRLYIAYGDKPTRGQAASPDHGHTFSVLSHGPDQGHTDVAFTRDYVFWGSDDQSGRVFRTSRNTGATETLMGRSQYIWWLMAQDTRVYLGTMTSDWRGGERPVVLASDDQGGTWQKLLEGNQSRGDYEGFQGESRQMSASGWLYFSDGKQGYRVRALPMPGATSAGTG